MRRRAFLAACATAGVAGCRTDDAAADTEAAARTTGRPGSRTGDGVTATPAGTSPGGPSPAVDPATTTTSSTPSRSETTPSPSKTGLPPTGTASSTPPPALADYETTAVRVTTPGGDRLGSVTAAVADTPALRYTGLSDTERLPADRGMLFVYDEVGEHTYVMREMDFGIDIVYADEAGAITRIHHAPAPGPDEDGADQEYPGRGQYVLEVTYEWTTERGVDTGDVLRFDLDG